MPTPLRVLIVEDSPADAELLVHQLRRAGFEPEWKRVESEADFLAALPENPELVILDYSLPQFGAMRALHLSQERGVEVPIIVVSGSAGDPVALSVVEGGAQDYLMKDH